MYEQMVLKAFDGSDSLPSKDKIIVPPLKIQGIKTKLVPFIRENIPWDTDSGVWYEPFMGSGVVAFNIMPKRAVLSDINPYIIQFYKDLQLGEITPNIIRDYLEEEAPKLAATPADKNSYYYEVRNRFNSSHSSLDFLFLQRSNFNGMMRFSKNGYNVSFGRKPDRFRPALITKIVNQSKKVSDIITNLDWEFICQPWEKTVSNAKTNDFIYLDPPYIGRNTDYFIEWEDNDAENLSSYFNSRENIHFALSMWYENKYRKNDYIQKWRGKLFTNEHFYFIGGKKKNRNPMIEALIIG